MADDDPPDYTGYKRPNYFNAQLLGEADFKDEQSYHLEMLRRLNRGLNISGVVEGLQVTKSHGGVAVAPGMAIDALGREVLLVSGASLDASAFAEYEGQSGILVAVAYGEAASSDPADQYAGGTQSFKRFTPAPVLGAFKTLPPAADAANPPVVLAAVSVGAGGVTGVDNSARVPARTTMSSGMSLGLQDLTLAGGLQLTPGNTRRVWLQGNDLAFGNAGDDTTGLGHYNDAKPYADAKLLDGPVLYGHNGGALAGGGHNLALRWDGEGQVGVGLQTAGPQARLHVAGGPLRLDYSGDKDKTGLLFTLPDGASKATASVRLLPSTLVPDSGDLVISTQGGTDDRITFRRAGKPVLTMRDEGMILIGEDESDPQVVIGTSGLLSSKMWNVTQAIADYHNTGSVGARVTGSAKFSTRGGTLLIFATGSVYAVDSGMTGFNIVIDDDPAFTIQVGATAGDVYSKACVGIRVVPDIKAGEHTVALQSFNAKAGPGEYFNVTIMELPF